MASQLNEILKQQSVSVDSFSQKTADDTVVNVLCFDFNRTDYFCSISDVKEILEMSFICAYPVKVPGQVGVINVRGKIIPILTDSSHESNFVSQINEGLFNQTYRLMVFESKDRGSFAIIANTVIKKSIHSDQESKTSLNIEKKHYQIFQPDHLIASTLILPGVAA